MNLEAQKQLASAEYWDNKYTKDAEGHATPDREEHEWFQTFEQLRPFLEKQLPSVSESPRILQLGCGKSTLTADLYSLGYHNQVSIDFSRVAIEAMKTKHQALNLDWKVMDVRKLEMPDASFDVAIDKGTLDAMLHGSPWDPEDDVKANVKAYVDEVARVLKPGGRWFYITNLQPHFLKPLLPRPNTWDMKVEILQDVGGSFAYSGFVMTRESK